MIDDVLAEIKSRTTIKRGAEYRLWLPDEQLNDIEDFLANNHQYERVVSNNPNRILTDGRPARLVGDVSYGAFAGMKMYIGILGLNLVADGIAQKAIILEYDGDTSYVRIEKANFPLYSFSSGGQTVLMAGLLESGVLFSFFRSQRAVEDRLSIHQVATSWLPENHPRNSMDVSKAHEDGVLSEAEMKTRSFRALGDLTVFLARAYRTVQ